jgi:hypothetical protein
MQFDALQAGSMVLRMTWISTDDFGFLHLPISILFLDFLAEWLRADSSIIEHTVEQIVPSLNIQAGRQELKKKEGWRID